MFDVLLLDSISNLIYEIDENVVYSGLDSFDIDQISGNHLSCFLYVVIFGLKPPYDSGSRR